MWFQQRTFYKSLSKYLAIVLDAHTKEIINEKINKRHHKKLLISLLTSLEKRRKFHSD
jgi:hypothetical protein